MTDYDKDLATVRMELSANERIRPATTATASHALGRIVFRIEELVAENEILLAQFDAATRAYQDRIEELVAENERLKGKWGKERDRCPQCGTGIDGHRSVARLRRIEEAAGELLAANVTSSAYPEAKHALRAALEGEEA